MARPIKLGLDYFPMDTNVLKNIKIRRLMKKYESSGVLLYFSLLCDIYGNSYYIQINQDYLFDWADQMEKEDAEIKAMLDYMVEIDLFDAELWKQNILTSKSIQERYITAKGRYLNEKKLEKQYLLVPLPVIKTRVSPEKTPVCTVKSAQSIGEDSRVEFFNPSCLPDASEKFQNIALESPFLQDCEKMRRELLTDEEWLYSVSMLSGKGRRAIELLPQVMPLFEFHLITMGETETVVNVNNYKRRFQNWWRCLNFASANEIMEQNQKKECSARRTSRKSSKIEEAMVVAKRASEMAYQLMQQNPL